MKADLKPLGLRTNNAGGSDPVTGGPAPVAACFQKPPVSDQSSINQLIVHHTISLFFIVFMFVVGKRLLEK